MALPIWKVGWCGRVERDGHYRSGECTCTARMAGWKEGRMEEVKSCTDCEEDCIDGRKRDTYYAGPLEREKMRC